MFSSLESSPHNSYKYCSKITTSADPDGQLFPRGQKLDCICLCCSSGVHWNIYETVTLSCLIQEHTHEDIDQMFSTWARYYWSHTLETFHEVQLFVQNAYPSEATRPDIQYIPWVWNISQMVLNNFHSITGHTSPRYKIEII